MKQNKILIAIMWFAVVQGISIPLYLLTVTFWDKTIASEIVRLFSGTIFLILIYYIGRGRWIKFNLKSINSRHILLVLSVIILFIANNLFQKDHYKIADFKYTDLKKEFIFFLLFLVGKKLHIEAFSKII